MATTLMKMARPYNYLTTQRGIIRPSFLQSSTSVYSHTAACSYYMSQCGIINHHQGRDDNTKFTPPIYCRTYSISASPVTSSPANKMVTNTKKSPLSEELKSDIRKRKEKKKRNNKKIEDKKRKVKNDTHINSQPNHLPKQSSHTTSILFDTIAPHLEIRTLVALTKHLSRRILQDDDATKGKVALDGILDLLFETNNSNQDNGKYKWALKGHPWMRQSIQDYCMGRKLDRPNKIHQLASDNNINPPLPHENDPTYPPNRNRQLYKQHLNTLIEAREVSLRHPIFWSENTKRLSGYTKSKIIKSKQQLEYQEKLQNKHSRKSDGQLIVEAEEVLDVLMSRLPIPHFNKFMGRLRGYVLKLDNDNQVKGESGQSNDTSDSWYIEDEDNPGSSKSTTPLPELPESRAAHTDYIPILGKFLKNCSDSHSHLVATDLASYFYMEIPSSEAASSEKRSALAIQRQKELHSTEKRYNKAKKEFVEAMMLLQHFFADMPDGSVSNSKNGTLRAKSEDQKLQDGDDLLVAAFKKAQEPYSLESREKQKEELSETLKDLDQLGDDETSETKTNGVGRPMKVHLRFTAIKMESTEPAELEENILFINNLPIDITEEEIDDIYSRFGPLDSIELFNLRPDLDPGPLTKKMKEKRRRKKSRMKNSFSSFEIRQHRPRSPVYGMLRFQTDEGYKIATSPELCIFGCVIRRHPVLSIKHDDLQTLYLEQFQSDLSPLDVENQLSQLLQLHVMLDGMKGVGRNELVTDTSLSKRLPVSCQVKFDNFHEAFQAYQLLQEGVSPLMGEKSQVNWFRTPANALDWWTRDLHF